MESVKQKQDTATRDDSQCEAEETESILSSEPEIERLREELASERERGLRTMADFSNYRRQAQRERARLEHSGKKELLLALLEVMDDFDRALAHTNETTDAVADGLRLIHQRLSGVLQSHRVTSFASVGLPFDPTVHEAMSTVESTEHQSGTVYSEDRRGYFCEDELLRPARVVVVR
jgi:molecular chaperone GrpE